ncbi:uncharacterized protein LOC131019667 [Salvia miltiorrhiza]|uniref:uncharacterized protein LOC131019667 n=1 Tax=Salvia miltiorrhiza TaxID=226208 RepID=UPI0025AC5F9D|nr:uncharacterized protein LOC131019667 [Salvia miltiorrhiza]
MDVSKAVPDFFDVKCGDRVFVLEFGYEDLPYYCHSCCVVGHATTSCRRYKEGMNDTEGQPAGKGTDPAPVQQHRSKWKQVDRKQACSEASLQMVVYEKGGILNPSNRDSALGDDEMDTFPDSTREEVVGSLNLGSDAAQVDLHNPFAAPESLDAEVQLDNEVVSEHSVGDNMADKSVGMEIVPVMNDTTRHPVETTTVSDTQVDIVTLHCSNTDMALTVTPGKATMEDPPIIRGRGRPKGASKKGKVSDSSIKNRLRRIIKNGMSSDKQATGRVAGAVL